MLLTPTLSRAPETDPALDQPQLYARGLDHVRRLSRRLWTDHNLHDPGITTLELLCYALTDLAYRARFPLEDLLASPADSAAAMAGQFVTAGQILPGRPVTVGDYRKLLIDLPGIKNAWLHPAPQRLYADPVKATLLTAPSKEAGVRPVDLKGLYQVRLEYMDDVTTAERRAAIDAAALATLHANRNLGEDFVAVEAVEGQDYSLCAELELEGDADTDRVAARLAYDVQRYLAPPVHNYSLSEMLDRRHADGSPYTVAEIFEGPRLDHGFIDDDELAAADLRSEVRLSDIVGIIMDIPGVRAVRDIVVNALAADGTAIPPADKWRLAVPPGKQPRLATSHGRLVFYKRNIPIPADLGRVAALLDAMNEAERRKLETPSAEDIPIPRGRYRNPGAYRSFQHHFPALYGLADEGLPASASPRRQAQALQLKAYLLFFDQAMANYFAQLANLGQLFSRRPEVGRTYFSQLVHSFPDWEKIYGAGFDTAALAQLVEADGAGWERRNRFLDHLLARFAEEFHQYVHIMQARFGLGAAGAAAVKAAFLDDLPRLGAERGVAYNCRKKGGADLWNSPNVSGLERRVARLLGIANFFRRNLGEVSYDTYTELDKTPGDEYRFRVKHPVSGKILLSSSTHYATPADAHREMEKAIGRAQLPEGYEKKTSTDGRHYFNIVAGDGEVLARRIEYFASAAERDAACEALMTHLRDFYSGEGMYLIEHILLRPREAGDPLMPICVDPNCTDCADDDPYSYRLSMVLPAYAGRFQDMDFRRFVEDCLRQETPAHLLPKICWVNGADMAAIESAYRDWISLQAGAATANRGAKIGALIDALTRAKNVYPVEALHDCGKPDQPPFILGRTALGSSGSPS